MDNEEQPLSWVEKGLGRRRDRHRSRSGHKMLRMGFLLAAILWLGVIFRFSSQPYQQQTILPFLKQHVSEQKLQHALPDVTFQYNHSRVDSQAKPYQFIEFLFRKSGHITVYAIYAFLLSLALLKVREHGVVKAYVILMMVAVTASLDEWNQTRVVGRTGIVSDLGFDLTGGILGLCAAAVLYRIKNRKLKERKW